MHRYRIAATALATLLAATAAAVGPAGPAAADDPTETSYSLGVLVLKYFPLTADGQNIDINVTGDVGDSLSSIRTKTDSITSNLVSDLALGSTYHGYADPSATPALTYHVVDTDEIDTAVPTVSNPSYHPIHDDLYDPYQVRPDYHTILADQDICDYVENQGVDEVWIYAYQGSSQLKIDESKMAGPNGDVSNSWVKNEMPVCAKTYTVYTYNYQRGTAEALHSHAHQFEYELSYFDNHLFRDLFEGTAYPGTTTSPGRCGSVHNPPNAQFEYDWDDTTAHDSDCLDWDPDGLGTTTSISCATWGCNGVTDTDNPQLNYVIWWMQNLPGRDNTVTYGGAPMRNWWDAHGDWDAMASSGATLTLPVSVSCSVHYAESDWAGGFSTSLTITNTGTTAINGWTLAFSFPGDQQITSSWDSSFSQTGSDVTLTNTTTNPTIAAGTSVYPGFQGTWNTNDTHPSAFTLNGTTCSVV